MVREIESKLAKLGDILDPVQVDVPDRRLQLIIWLDDRKAWAWDVAFMTEGADDRPRQRRFSDSERSGKGDHVAGPEPPGQRRTKHLCGPFVREDHLGARGIVSVTVVPLPRAETRSTLPPCASMN